MNEQLNLHEIRRQHALGYGQCHVDDLIAEVERLRDEIMDARQACPSVRMQDHFDKPLLALINLEVSRGFNRDAEIDKLRAALHGSEAGPQRDKRWTVEHLAEAAIRRASQGCESAGDSNCYRDDAIVPLEDLCDPCLIDALRARMEELAVKTVAEAGPQEAREEQVVLKKRNPPNLTVRDALLLFGQHEKQCASHRSTNELLLCCDCYFGTCLAWYAMPQPDGPPQSQLTPTTMCPDGALHVLRCIRCEVPTAGSEAGVSARVLDEVQAKVQQLGVHHLDGTFNGEKLSYVLVRRSQVNEILNAVRAALGVSPAAPEKE